MLFIQYFDKIIIKYDIVAELQSKITAYYCEVNDVKVFVKIFIENYAMHCCGL